MQTCLVQKFLICKKRTINTYIDWLQNDSSSTIILVLHHLLSMFSFLLWTVTEESVEATQCNVGTIKIPSLWTAPSHHCCSLNTYLCIYALPFCNKKLSCRRDCATFCVIEYFAVTQGHSRSFEMTLREIWQPYLATLLTQAYSRTQQTIKVTNHYTF